MFDSDKGNTLFESTFLFNQSGRYFGKRQFRRDAELIKCNHLQVLHQPLV
jgi:hypothetical protein